MFTYARRDLAANFHKDNFDEDLLSSGLGEIRKSSSSFFFVKLSNVSLFHRIN